MRLPIAVLAVIALVFLPASFLVAGIDRSGSPPAWDHVADSSKELLVGPSGDLKWKFSGTTINARDIVPDNTCTADAAASLNAAIVAMAPSGNTGPGSKGVRLFIPKGCYRLSTPLRLSRQVAVFGDGGSGGTASTILQPDKNVIGIVFERYNTSADGGQGDWSTVRDISIQYAAQTTSDWQASHAYVLGDTVRSKISGSGVNAVAGANWNPDVVFKCTTAGTSAGSEPAWGSKAEGQTQTDGGVTWTAIVVSGVRMRARGKVENLYVSNSPGSCFRVDGSTSGSPSTNANAWHLQYARLVSCAQDGIYTTGIDSNAGQALYADIAFCGYWGVDDNGTLGNVHEGHQVDGCLLGPYRSKGLSTSNEFIGCYSEGSQPPSDIDVPSIVVGGLHGAGFTTASTAMRLAGVGPESGRGGIYNPVVFSNPRSTHSTHMQISPNSDAAFNITGDTTGAGGFTFGPIASTGDPRYGWWDWGSDSTQSIMSFSSAAAAEGHGYPWLPRGFFFGPTAGGGKRAFWTVDNTKPLSSAVITPKYSTSSIIFNSDQTPQAGGYQNGILGWQVVYQSASAGTTQTIRWPHFGVINQIDATNQSGSPYIIDPLEHAGVMFTNLGATGKTYFTLPQDGGFPSIRTTEFAFFVDDSDGIRLTLPASHVIRWGSHVTAGAGYLESTEIGAWIRLKIEETSSSNVIYVVNDIAGRWTTSGGASWNPPNSAASATSGDLVSFSDTTGTNIADSGVPLANVVLVSRTVTAGTGLAGGGALTSDITLSASFGTAVNTICQGNDARLPTAAEKTKLTAMDSGEAVSAAGTTQGTATALSALTRVHKVSGITGSQPGVILPTGEPLGTTHSIFADATEGNILKVYPGVGDSFTSLTTNAQMRVVAIGAMRATVVVSSGGVTTWDMVFAPSAQDDLNISFRNPMRFNSFAADFRDASTIFRAGVSIQGGAADFNDNGSGNNRITFPTDKTIGFWLGAGSTHYVDVNSNAGVEKFTFLKQVAVSIPSTIAPTGTTGNVDWTNGNGQIVSAISASGNMTWTFSNPVAGASYVLKVLQSNTTSRTFTLPTTKWAGGTAYVATAATGSTDLINFYYDGTNYLGSYTLDHK